MPDAVKSPREQVQDQLVDFLATHQRSNTGSLRFDAPYGVIAGVHPLPRGGKVRTITFGVARYLDACLTIWNVDRITCEARGPLAHTLDRAIFDSADTCIESLKKI